MKSHLLKYAVVISFLYTACSDNSQSSELITSGIKIESDQVIAFFPKDSLTKDRMDEIVDSLNIGIRAAKKYLNGPHAWQVYGDKPVTYYFEPGNFTSAADVKGDIFIPLHRIKNYRAPWMHETMHSLLRSKQGNWNESNSLMRYFDMPIWFTEGMAEYLAVKLEVTDSIRKFDLMKFGGYSKVDSSCANYLKNQPELLDHIGTSGIPTDMLTNRKEFAPPFYTCSCSFTKFLAETYSLNALLIAISSFQEEHDKIEELTGKKLSVLKSDWLSYLKSKTSPQPLVAN